MKLDRHPEYMDYVAVAVSVLAALGLGFFPYISDDLEHSLSVRDSFLYGKPLNWESYFNYAVTIFEYKHFRLSNLLMPPIILWPRWLSAVISCAALAFVYVSGARIGRFERSPLRYGLYISLIIFLFPWVDQLYLLSFQVPYLWGAAFAMLLLYLFVRKTKAGNVSMLLVGLLVGIWHEAYAGSLLVGFVTVAACFKQYRTGRSVAAVAGLSAGILCDAAPLILFNKWEPGITLQGRMSLVYPFMGVIVLYMIADAVALLGRKKARVCTPVNVLLSTVALTALLLALFFKSGARVCGVGIISAIVGLLQLKSGGNRSKYINAVIVPAILLFTVFHLVMVDVMCCRLRRQTDYVVSRYRQGASMPIFAPMTLRPDVPWYLMQKPYYDWFAHSWTLGSFNNAYGSGREPLSVVPLPLKDFSPAKATKLCGDAGLYIYAGYMVGVVPAGELFMVDYGAGERVLECKVTPLRSTVDGRCYYWLYPETSFWEQVVFPHPKRVDIYTE